MARLGSFQGTRPAGLAEDKERATVPLNTDRRDLALVGEIGLTLSNPVLAIQRVLEDLGTTRVPTQAQIGQLTSALKSVRTIARHSQQIARLGSGRLRQSHEKLKLNILVLEALQEREPLFKQLGVELYHGIKPVEVIVDAGLLICLLDAALEWALSIGRRLIITLEMKNWPEHGILLIRASDKPRRGDSGSDSDRIDEDEEMGSVLAWALLAETAGAMGVSVDRITSASESAVMIEFARTVKRLEGLTAIEVDTGFDTLQGESKSMAGHRVLVISRDDMLRTDIQNTARMMGLTTDFVTTSRQAVNFCCLETPHMVIIDERVRDDTFDELCENLRKTDLNYPFIEITNQSNVLEMAGWMSDSMTRVSRDSLHAKLGSILAMELAKVS